MDYTFAVNGSNLYDNNYSADKTFYYQASPFSRWVFTTNAIDCWVKVYSNLFGSYPAFVDVSVLIDGSLYTTLNVAADGYSTFQFSMPSGWKMVEFVCSLQSKPAGTVLGVYLTAVYFSGNLAVNELVPHVPQYVVYGDSIAVGGNSSNPSAEAWSVLLRTTYHYLVAVDAWGYRTLFSDAPDAAGRIALAFQLGGYFPSSGIWLAIGTNDYGLETQSAADFGTAYADLLDQLRLQAPSRKVYCQVPITRSSEVANVFGDTLDDYRSAIANAQASRSDWTVLVPEMTVALDDGVHPSTAGHAVYAANVAAILP